MIKRILAFCAALALLLSLTVFSASAENGEFLIDSAGLLSESERETLSEQLREISERQQFAIVIVTMENLDGDMTSRETADALYDDGGYGYGEERDGCLLLRTLNPRYVYVSTCGFGEKAIDPKLDDIFDEIEDDMISDRYFEAFTKFAELCDSRVDSARKFPLARNLLICLGIGLFIGLIVILAMKSQLKSVKRQDYAQNYLDEGSFQVTVAKDLFLYTNVTRTRIEKSSSSGSSGGSSHGGGGRSM